MGQREEAGKVKTKSSRLKGQRGAGGCWRSASLEVRGEIGREHGAMMGQRELERWPAEVGKPYKLKAQG